MTYHEVITYFGSQEKIALTLGIKQPSVSCWGRKIPARHQYALEVLTAGALRVDADLRRPRVVA